MWVVPFPQQEHSSAAERIFWPAQSHFHEGFCQLCYIGQGQKVNDSLRDRAVPEKLLVWLRLTGCHSGAMSLVIFSLPLQHAGLYLSHE